MYKARNLIAFHLFILLFVSTIKLNASNPNFLAKPDSLSEDATISLLTCAPGQELYSVFGHTAIRVNDPDNETDLVYNYGTFDFNTPFFYLKFGHGSLDYLLSVSRFDQFLREYFVSGRTVLEHELRLSETMKQDLFDALQTNALPENRAYKYDFFYDNCATRVGDIILEVLNMPVVFTNARDSMELTFREAIHPYLEQKKWTKLGIDLVLGTPADDATDSISVMFLPDHLMHQFEGIYYGSDSNNNKLTSNPNTVLDFSNSFDVTEEAGIDPLLILWILALLIGLFSLQEIPGKFSLKYLDILLYALIGFAGIIIAYLMFISHHEVTSPNWNLLWANPLWFLFVRTVNTNNFVTIVKKIQFVILIFLIMFSWTLPQYFPADFYPLWIILIIRLGSSVYRKKLRQFLA